MLTVPGSVFVSHSTRDAEYVARLAGHLRAAGITPWTDNAETRPGDQWKQHLRHRIDTCAVMLVVMSAAAEASPRVAHELDRARRRGVPVLPLLLDGEPFLSLSTLPYADARGGVLPDDRFMERLAGMVSAAAARSGQLIVGDLPAAAPAWQERPGLLGRLTAPPDGARTVVLCASDGQPGVGTTQLAAACAWLRIRHGWPVVVWVTAETRSGIVSALDQVAAAAGIRDPDTGPELAARAAVQWLSTHPGPCLLVYDNAVDAELIRSWTPPAGSVHTVVTTTDSDLGALGTQVDVPGFTPEEAVTYLGQRTGLDDPVGAGDLAGRLGRTPLALAQAAALIGAGRRYPSYAAYGHALAGISVDRLLPSRPDDPYPSGVTEAILLGLDDLARVDRDGDARRLLDHLAVLAPNGADRVLLRQLWERSRPRWRQLTGRGAGVAVETVLPALTERALAATTARADRVVVHRLVQHVVRGRRQRAGSMDAVLRAAAGALYVAGTQVGAEPATRSVIAEYAAHADALSTLPANGHTRPWLVNTRLWMLRWLCEVQEYEAAAAIGPSLLHDCERLYGTDDDATREARADLIIPLLVTRQTDEAIAAAERTLADRYRLGGLDDPATLISRRELACVYWLAGRLDQAIDLFKHTIADSERVRGPDHPETLTARGFLAHTYRDAGRLDEAIALYEQTLADRQRVLGPDHPDTWRSRTYLADARAKREPRNGAGPPATSS